MNDYRKVMGSYWNGVYYERPHGAGKSFFNGRDRLCGDYCGSRASGHIVGQKI